MGQAQAAVGPRLRVPVPVSVRGARPRAVDVAWAVEPEVPRQEQLVLRRFGRTF